MPENHILKEKLGVSPSATETVKRIQTSRFKIISHPGARIKVIQRKCGNTDIGTKSSTSTREDLPIDEISTVARNLGPIFISDPNLDSRGSSLEKVQLPSTAKAVSSGTEQRQRKGIDRYTSEDPKYNTIFSKMATSSSKIASPYAPPQRTLRQSSPHLVELESMPQYEEITPTGFFSWIFKSPPLIRDPTETRTSQEQDAVANKCMDIYSHPLTSYHLNREAHIEFLEAGLGLDEDGNQLWSRFVTLDASRPWIMYWCLIGLHTLGADLMPYRARLISTLRPIQNESGGFGGGNGQISHLAVSYAAVLALCCVGGTEAYEMIDRNAMWKWISSLKSVDGGFKVSNGGEEDVRGAYCALVIIALLGLPTGLRKEDQERLIEEAKKRGIPGEEVPRSLIDRSCEYLGSCQTYEGGMAGSPGGNEAHGGYAFCALAGLCCIGAPEDVLNKYLNLPKFIQWLSARQYAPEGGFSGRTNKLVDGCYSTWAGGCWALVEAALNNVGVKQKKGVVGSLWCREGLAKYILGCCQSPRGGLRDKPGKGPDFYHTAYILLGLGGAQNYYYYEERQVKATSAEDDEQYPSTSSTVIGETQVDLPLQAPFNWHTSPNIPVCEPTPEKRYELIPSCYALNDPEQGDYLDVLPSVVSGKEGVATAEDFGEQMLLMDDESLIETKRNPKWWNGDRVRRAHPVFNVPFDRVREWQGYFDDQI